MKVAKLIFVAVAAALLGLATGARAESAATYPSANVELVIPFTAGGTTDVIGRLVAQYVSQKWGHAVVVTNKPGATGAIASELVARAKPDGYTLLIATASTHAVLPAYRSDLPYDTVTSFAPATLLATFPNMLVVTPKLPVKTVADLIALLKRKPGKLTFSSSGVGGTVHFAGELFKLMTGTNMLHVPYKGSSAALNDLVAGNVDLTIDNMSTVWPLVQQGQLRALGVAGPHRVAAAPDVPTIAETVPGFDVTSWVGVVAPAGTPPDIVTKISKMFGEAVNDPAIKKKLEALGASSASDTPDTFTTFIRTDRAKWEKVAEEAHISEKSKTQK